MSDAERSVAFTATTPSGIEIQFEAEPKRLYRIRPSSEGIDVEPEWREVVSVTTALEILDKPALPWWGMRVGVEGMIELVKRGMVVLTQTPEGEPALAAPEGWVPEGAAAKDCDPLGFGAVWQYARSDLIEPILTNQRLTVNHVKSEAGDRGTNVHTALEGWIKDRTVPEPSFFPAEQQGYVRGLRAFLEDLGEVKTAEAEVMVGSVEHGFAGRYDLEAVMYKANLVTKVASPTGKVPEERIVVDGRTLIDLKTSKGVYVSHFLQLAAYEGARLECGYQPTKQQMVVRVGADGTYEVKVSPCVFDDYLAVLYVYGVLQDIKSR